MKVMWNRVSTNDWRITSMIPGMSRSFCPHVCAQKAFIPGNHLANMFTCSQYWKPPRYTLPNTTNTMLRCQSISSLLRFSTASCVMRSATDVLTVATMMLNQNGSAFGKARMAAIMPGLEPSALLPAGAVDIARRRACPAAVLPNAGAEAAATFASALAARGCCLATSPPPKRPSPCTALAHSCWEATDVARGTLAAPPLEASATLRHPSTACARVVETACRTKARPAANILEIW
mmetsp:Transcript_21762/g.68290  ORF Transcript_21762/g.68290 Transcript_21762/m.68290 type:complete len:235 (+) Transcript_21762:522-1226(+)